MDQPYTLNRNGRGNRFGSRNRPVSTFAFDEGRKISQKKDSKKERRLAKAAHSNAPLTMKRQESMKRASLANAAKNRRESIGKKTMSFGFSPSSPTGGDESVSSFRFHEEHKLSLSFSSGIPIIEKDFIARRMPFRVKLRRFMALSRTGMAIDMSGSLISLLATILYIWETYNEDLAEVFNQWELIFSSLFALEYFLRFYIAIDRWKFVTHSTSVLDLLTIFPGFLGVLEIQEGSLYLELFKTARVIRVARILRMRRMVTYLSLEYSQMLAECVIIIISLLLVFGGLILVLENSYLEANYEETLYFHEVMYFLVVTLTTVGYGDISPASFTGRVVTSIFMLFFAYYIPKVTTDLIALSSEVSEYALARYRLDPYSGHVLVCGDINPSSLKAFLEEVFHSDHGTVVFTVVVLADTEPSSEMEALLNEPSYKDTLCYIQGSALSYYDLERAKASYALGCFVLANAQSQHEDAMDSITILKALSIKRFAAIAQDRHIKVCVQLMNPQSKNHFTSGALAIAEASQIELPMMDPVVCINELRLSILAKSCHCHGITALINNLAISQDTIVKEDSAEWFKEYAAGCDYEIYRTKLTDHFSGVKYIQVVDLFYKKLGLLVIAIEATLPRTDDDEDDFANSPRRSQLFLNPAKSIIPNVNVCEVYAYVIATDSSEANISSFISYAEHERENQGRRRNSKIVPENLIHSHGNHGKHNVDQKKLSFFEALMLLNRDQAISEHQPGGMGLLLEEISDEEDEEEDEDEEKSVSDHESNEADEHNAILHSHYHSEVRYLHSVTVRTSLGTDFPYVRSHILLTGNVVNLPELLKPLRSSTLGLYNSNRPIVVLTKTPITPLQFKAINRIPSIYFVHGNSSDSVDLERAGLKYASCAIILAKGARKTKNIHEALIDSDGIFTYQTIKKMNSKLPLTVELANADNAKFLSNYSDMASSNGAGIYANALYAAGDIHFGSLADKLICQSFYNPYVMQVVLHLLKGRAETKLTTKEVEMWKDYIHSEEQSDVYQIPVPDTLIDKTYTDLFDFFIEKTMVPIGLLRGLNKEKGNSHHYVVTNPAPDAKLYENDRVFILSCDCPSLELQKKSFSEIIEDLRKRNSLKRNSVVEKSRYGMMEQQVLEALQKLEVTSTTMVEKLQKDIADAAT